MSSTQWPEPPAERKARKERVRREAREPQDEYDDWVVDRDGIAYPYPGPRPGTYAWGAS